MSIVVVPEGRHTLPPLPYSYEALEPVISAKSLQIHHDILHKAYVEELNKTEMELRGARESNDFKNIKCLEKALAFYGSGHILHSIYWTVMCPSGESGSPGNLTANAISFSFGNFNAFKEQFLSAGEKVEGAGWAVLAYQPAFGRAVILQSEKHQNLTQWGSIPILVMDVWEHAYYLDYQSKRREYEDKWWSIINWNEVEKRFVGAINGRLVLTI